MQKHGLMLTMETNQNTNDMTQTYTRDMIGETNLRSNQESGLNKTMKIFVIIVLVVLGCSIGFTAYRYAQLLRLTSQTTTLLGMRFRRLDLSQSMISWLTTGVIGAINWGYYALAKLYL